MIPATYDFPDHYQGDGLEQFSITLMHDATTPVDLTGASVKMTLKNGSKDAYTFSSEAGSISVSPGGEISFVKNNSLPIPSGRHLYDLQVTDSTGFVRTYIKGNWNIIADITK